MCLQKTDKWCYENEKLTFYKNDCERNQKFLAEPRLL